VTYINRTAGLTIKPKYISIIYITNENYKSYSFSINILVSFYLYTYIILNTLIMQDKLNSEHRYHYLGSKQFFRQVRFFENINVYFM